MTEIPERQEGQTWANYFIERLKERGVDANLQEGQVVQDEGIDEQELVYVLPSWKPQVEIGLGYIMYKSSRIALDNSLERLTDLKFKYRSRAKITVNDPHPGDSSNPLDWCILRLRDNSTKFSALTTGNLTNRITADMPAAEALCKLADFVKQRQEFYKQEEQK